MKIRIRDGNLELDLELPCPTSISYTKEHVTHAISEFLRIKEAQSKT